MVMLARLPTRNAPLPQAARCAALVDYLRGLVLAAPVGFERCQALFVDRQHRYLGDTAFGMSGMNMLSLRMRAMFSEAFRLEAHGIILAHNHPSGQCRPSACDIAATQRLQEIARALDITVIDHLIFTTEAAYSMRAGGLL